MRTIYIKNNANTPFTFPYFYKVIEINSGTTKTLTVTQDTIETESEEDFFEQVSFIKNTLCKDTGAEEITREEFDAFYMETVNKINKTAAA